MKRTSAKHRPPVAPKRLHIVFYRNPNGTMGEPCAYKSKKWITDDWGRESAEGYIVRTYVLEPKP
jgi:hypothetical protein